MARGYAKPCEISITFACAIPTLTPGAKSIPVTTDSLTLLLLATFIAIVALLISFRRRRQQAGGTSKPDASPVLPLAVGVKAYMKGDHARALPILQHYADAGELKAQQLLARMYYSGHGVEKDQDRYLFWLERAADNGDRAARARLKKLKRTAPGSPQG